jgi:hypothetical protein
MSPEELENLLEQYKTLTGSWASEKRMDIKRELDLRKQKGGNQNETN